MGICVYCGEVGKLSREHVYSSGILKVFAKDAPFTIDDARGVAHKGDPMIKDICCECNSGLSECDAEMILLTREHLQETPKPGSAMNYDETKILRWVVKTASNITRSNPSPRDWWRSCIPFILGGECELQSADCFFTPWADLSPSKMATEIGMVRTISARETLLVGFSAGHSSRIDEQLDLGFAIKVGFGVFLFLLWKPKCEDRISVVDELGSYGWRALGDLDDLPRTAFSPTSSSAFHVICDPKRHIQDVIRSDERVKGTLGKSE